MTNIVEFPGLGIVLEVNNVAFSIAGINIYWYGVLIAVGMFLAVLFAFSQARSFGVDPDRMVEVIICGLVLAIVCGRLYYVLFSDLEYNTFFDIINLRAGGIAIYGGIIGAFIGALLGCKWFKVPVLPMFDITAMGFLIGQAIGRWGNFVNQEAFGSNTTMPWGMISPATTSYLQQNQALLSSQGVAVDPFAPVHPTFLYESIWCAIGFLLLFLYRKHRKFNGELFLFYVIWYGIGRFIIEGLRTDSLMVPGVNLRVSQLLAALSVLVAVVVWVIARVKTAGRPLKVPEIPPHTAKVKVETPSGEKTVEISWPSSAKAPTKEERLEMARLTLEEAGEPLTEEQAEAEEKAAREEQEAEERIFDSGVQPVEDDGQADAAAQTKKEKQETDATIKGEDDEDGTEDH